MPTGGFDDPALASLPPGGNLYFQADQAVATKVPAEQGVDPGGPGRAQARDLYSPGGEGVPPKLMFGEGTAYTGAGEHIVKASSSSKGHVSEILNFHGSPAPWVLIGILLVAGILHLEANGKASFGGKL
jgi:hypothetical protein